MLVFLTHESSSSFERMTSLCLHPTLLPCKTVLMLCSLCMLCICVQVGVLVFLAHVGSFLPCEKAIVGHTSHASALHTHAVGW